MTTLTAKAARPAPTVLADVVPGDRLRDATVIVAGALLTALGAQIALPMPPSPVPITGQTLAVILAGSALGARRGAISQALYVCLGLFLPVYADGAQGVHVLFGATGGYLIGFVIAAALVGALAERGSDRRLVAATGSFIAAQLAIFGIGVPWLKVATDMDWTTAAHEGFTIFIVGGIVKALVAGAALPSAWKLLRRAGSSR